jgi:cellulose biosynthesis protein BcsQ
MNRTRIYLFGGVAGGTGKTAVALNMLACLGLAGRKNFLVDTSPLHTLRTLLSAATAQSIPPTGRPAIQDCATVEHRDSLLSLDCYSADAVSVNVSAPGEIPQVVADALSRLRKDGAAGRESREATAAPDAPVTAAMPDATTEPATRVIIDCPTITDLSYLHRHLPGSTAVLVVSPTPWEASQVRDLLGLTKDTPGLHAGVIGEGWLERIRDCRVVVSKHDGSDKGHKKIVAELRAAIPSQLAKVQVPFDASLGRAFTAGKSVVLVDPSAPSAIACVRLAREVFRL